MTVSSIPRRQLVAASIALAGLAAIGVRRLPGLRAEPLEFEPLDRPPGFRRLEAGPSSAAFDPLAGLGQSGAAPAPPRDLCAALFGAEPLPPDQVPVAYFSDYNCPYCRVLSERLRDLEGTLPVRIRWHELPLLGPGSEAAARGALAAARQDGYAEFHDRLMTTSFRATDGYLATVAREEGLDADRLIEDMTSQAVTDHLETSRRLAALFGIFGTPALVVGRTLVQGEVSKDTFTRLVEIERQEGPLPCA